MTYTPTTEHVRMLYADYSHGGHVNDGRAEEFDRWLTENNRQVAEAAWDDAIDAVKSLGGGRNEFLSALLHNHVQLNPHRTPQPTEGES